MYISCFQVVLVGGTRDLCGDEAVMVISNIPSNIEAVTRTFIDNPCDGATVSQASTVTGTHI